MCSSLPTLYHERDTHSLCDGLTGSEACRVGSRGGPHYKWHPLRMLRSRGGGKLSLRREFSQRPRSTCHAAAEAEQWLCSQMDQMEGIKTGDPLSSSFTIRSSTRFLRSEARPAVLPPGERARHSACPFLRRGTGRMSMNFHKMYVCTSML